jgi:hypothetical protein
MLARSLFLLALLMPFAVQARPEPTPPTGTVVPLPEPTVPVRDALAALERAFPGVVQDRADLPSATVTVPGGKRLFWEVLDDLADRTKTSLRVLPTEGKIQFLPGVVPLPGGVPMPVHHYGPFRLVCRRVTNSLDLETNTPSSLATFEVDWEPSLQPFYLETRPQGLTVVDGQGQSLRGPADGSGPVPVDGRLGLTFDVRLPPLPRSEKTIRSVTGSLSAVVPTRMVSVTLPTFARLEAAASAEAPELAFPAGGPAGRVRTLVRTRDRWTVRVVLPTPPGNATFESYQSWVIQNDMTLRTTEGKVWKSASYLLERNSPTSSVVSYHFLVRDCPGPVDPAQWSVHYTTPAGIVQMEVPFRFAQVPLP